MVGDLKEAVFVVSPTATGPIGGGLMGTMPTEEALAEVAAPETGGPAGGTLYFDLEFGKLTFLQKNFTLINRMFFNTL